MSCVSPCCRHYRENPILVDNRIRPNSAGCRLWGRISMSRCSLFHLSGWVLHLRSVSFGTNYKPIGLYYTPERTNRCLPSFRLVKLWLALTSRKTPWLFPLPLTHTNYERCSLWTGLQCPCSCNKQTQVPTGFEDLENQGARAVKLLTYPNC